ncbi:MAG: hypothetical protein KF690_12055 [Bacteroidetes bacterium]|nr:hypothetical protein [Bacteroidota bacterium]
MSQGPHRRSLLHLGLAAILSLVVTTDTSADQCDIVLPQEGHTFSSDQQLNYKFSGTPHTVFSVDVRRDGGPAVLAARFVFTMPASGTYTGRASAHSA